MKQVHVIISLIRKKYAHLFGIGNVRSNEVVPFTEYG
jgi:hypothetical protein